MEVKARPQDSLILPDVEGYAQKIVKYNHDKSAEDRFCAQWVYPHLSRPPPVDLELLSVIIAMKRDDLGIRYTVYIHI